MFFFPEVYAASVHTDLDSVLILMYSSKIQTWTGLCFNFDVLAQQGGRGKTTSATLSKGEEG